MNMTTLLSYEPCCGHLWAVLFSCYVSLMAGFEKLCPKPRHSGDGREQGALAGLMQKTPGA